MEKLTSKELYSILISKVISKKSSILTSQQYFNSLFPDSIYLLPRKISTSTNFRTFQYKILYNVLYLNKMLFRFRKSPSPLCSFYKLHDKTLIHFFGSCNQVISLWIEIKLLFSEYIQLTLLSQQIVAFSLLKGTDKAFLIQNMTLMVFKLYIYKSRVSGRLNFNTFLHQLVKVKNLEKGVTFNKKQKHDMFLRKWFIIALKICCHNENVQYEQ